MNAHVPLAEIRREQTIRLRETYCDFVYNPDYAKVTEFFFSKIYDTSYKDKRDEAFNRLYEKLLAAVGEERITRVTMLKELNELTDELDLAVAQKHQELFGAAKVNRRSYEEAFARTDREEDRERQVFLLIETTRFFHKLAHLPFLGFVITPTKIAARVMKMEHLMDFFMEGYHAFKSVKNADPFFEAVERREREYRHKLYERYGVKHIKRSK
ncbi:MAG: hypothetical protein NZM25_02080 [Leptospiraceae bacterium]|nr:hypothetical protein [Leptospiraceae bacterium]MDW8306965.1 hypothetical protein [Leptospiraceae bacterium]